MDLTLLVDRLREHSASIDYFESGKPHKRTFAEAHADVAALVEDLRSMGVQSGHRIGCFCASNCYEALVVELALLELRCVVVQFVSEVIEEHGSNVAERFDLALLIAVRAPQSAGVPDESWVLRVSGLDLSQSAVARSATADPESWSRTPAYVFSSGTTGGLKCIATDRRGVEDIVDMLPQLFPYGSSDRFIMFLPMANFQQRFLLYAAIDRGIDLVIVEPRTLMLGLQRFSPSIMLAPPAFYDAIVNRARNQAFIARVLFACADALSSVGAGCAARWLLRPIASEVKKLLGGRLRLAITGMAPSRQSTLRSMQALGLPVYEAYGLTESGLIASNTPDACRLGSVGKVVPGASVEIASDGEVVVKKPAFPTSGYVGVDPDLLSETYVARGVIATGDVGHLDRDGYLYLNGRKKNIIITPGGEKVHPEEIETLLDDHPLIEKAVVLAMPTGKLVTVIAATDPSAATHDEIRSFVEQANKRLPFDGQIARVEFSDVPFSPETGLLTGNLKLNRPSIERHFSPRWS